MGSLKKEGSSKDLGEENVLVWYNFFIIIKFIIRKSRWGEGIWILDIFVGNSVRLNYKTRNYFTVF